MLIHPEKQQQWHIDIKATTWGYPVRWSGTGGNAMGGTGRSAVGYPRADTGTVTNPSSAARDPHTQSPGASVHFQAGLTFVDRVYRVLNNSLRSRGILKLNICTAGGEICRGKSFEVEGEQRQHLTHELHKAAETAKHSELLMAQ